MTTDPFTEAARAEAERRNPPIDRYPDDFTYPRSVLREHKRGEFAVGAEWARARLAAQRAEEVRAWAAQQYPSGTPLDQDRRMVAAETEAYLSGRSERDMSDLAQAAKHAGPVDPPAQEPTDAEVEAAGEVWQAHSRLAHPIEGLEPSCAECGYAFGWPGINESEERKRHREHVARAALSAARAARRDETGDRA